MNPEPVTEDDKRRCLAEQYIESAAEDMGALEVLYHDGFRYPHNACMLMARASEKYLKAKILLKGEDIGWIHDQTILLTQLGFSESDDVMDIGAQMSIYAVQANYPSVIRPTITGETAYATYDDLFRLLDSIRELEPIFVIASKPSDV